MSRKTGGTRGYERVLGLWWISWFGVIGSFIYVAGVEYRREYSESSPALAFSTLLVTATLTSWALFFICDNKLRGPRDAMVVRLLTVIGTINAVLSLLGVFYFVMIAPRVQ